MTRFVCAHCGAPAHHGWTLCKAHGKAFERAVDSGDYRAADRFLKPARKRRARRKPDQRKLFP